MQNKKINICFLGAFTAGGTESACFKVANGLCEKYNIFIISTSKMKNTFFLKKCIKFYNLQSNSIYKKNREIYYLLKNNKIDVLITLEAMTGIFSIVSAKLAGCKHIIWEHANYYQNQGSKWIQKIRQIELIVADAYVVLTKRDLSNFKKYFFFNTKLKKIYNIADTNICNSYSIDSKIIISVGHIRKIKNFSVIPEIAKIVFLKHDDWKWIIYGDTFGEEYNYIKNKINQYGLENNIIFYGRCNDMRLEYSKAAIYVMTSLQEGLPMVLLEAKSAGLPLVSFDIETGPDEIIRDGVNGFLIPPYDIKKMANKICELIEDNKKRIEFSNNSILDLELFEKKLILTQWQDLIDKVNNI